MSGDQLVQAWDITKSFYGVVVLLGENGAGKSTLVKILSGAFTCDSGRITIALSKNASVISSPSCATGERSTTAR